MLSKAEAMKVAMKLPGPPRAGEVMRFKSIEVGLAWMELHGLDPARNGLGHARWEMGVLVLKRGIEPAPVTPPPAPPHLFEMERGVVDEGE